MQFVSWGAEESVPPIRTAGGSVHLLTPSTEAALRAAIGDELLWAAPTLVDTMTSRLRIGERDASSFRRCRSGADGHGRLWQ